MSVFQSFKISDGVNENEFVSKDAEQLLMPKENEGDPDVTVAEAIDGIETGATDIDLHITDAEVKEAFEEAHSASVLQNILFSFNERRIGTWLFDKPLYQRTVVITATPNTTQEILITDLLGEDVLLAWLTGDQTGKRTISGEGAVAGSIDYISIPFYPATSAVTLEIQRGHNRADDSKAQSLLVKSLNGNTFELYATFRYVKVTD